MNEILKIILKCNRERKLLSGDDVKEICNIILKRNKYYFVNKIDILSHNPNDENCAGLYHDDHLFFFFDGIVNMLQGYCDDTTDLYTFDGAKVDIYNFYYLTIIFHELAHVRQQYIMDTARSSIEKKIFTLFLNLSLNREFYQENYCNILTEINAENVALVTANYFYSQLPKNFVTKNDRKAYQLSTLGTLLHSNYEIVSKKEMVISPSEHLIDSLNDDILASQNMNCDQYLNLIYKQNNLTIYKKMMLGLPLEYQEYAYAELLYNRLKSDDEINVIKKLQKRLS